jgi:indole-3-glycerol phosphate synthase
MSDSSPTAHGPARRDDSALDRIVRRKRQQVRATRAARPLDELKAAALAADPPRNLGSALEGPILRLVAEIRRPARSGVTAEVLFDPRIIAQEFAGAGAAALSVWTDDPKVGSELHLLRRARGYMALPVICWDFIIDEYQVCQARANQADAVALITALSSDDELQRLVQVTRELGMAPMMVVGDSWELDSALAAEPDVICIENRSLEGGSGDVARTERLAQHVPGDILVVSAHVRDLRGIAAAQRGAQQ